VFEALTEVLAELRGLHAAKPLHAANEAETRLKIIDRILFDGLGWNLADVAVEKPVGGITTSPSPRARRANDSPRTLYLDYLLEHRGTQYLVVEAKRAGRTFDLPVELNRSEYLLQHLLDHCGDALREVIQQAHDYAVKEGIPYASATNGSQWVLFRTFTSFVSLGKTKALIFRSLAEISKDASKFHRAFAPTAFSSGEIDSILSLPRSQTPRFAKTYNEVRGGDSGIGENHLAKAFGTVFPLFFDSLTAMGDEQALRECYVDTPPHKNYEREFAALLQRSLPHYLPSDTPLAMRDARPSVELVEQIAEDKPSVIILVGNIGVGKSTFVNHLLRVYLPGSSSSHWYIEDFIDDHEALAIDVDGGAIEARIYESLLSWVERQFPDLDPFQYDNLRKIFANDIKRLTHGARKKEFDKKPELFTSAEASLLDELSKDHKKLAVALLRHARASFHRPLCIAFDNVDRGSESFQQFIYTFAHRLSREAGCNVIVTMRHAVYEFARQHGVLDTRNDTIFQVTAPSLQAVFSKRIRFARRYLGAQGKRIKGVSEVDTRQVTDYLDVINDLLLGEQPEVKKCLESLSAGSIRLAFQYFKRFAMSGHTNVDTMIMAYNESRGRDARAPFFFGHFFRPFVLGTDYRFHTRRSPLVNLFAVAESSRDSHFLRIRLLSFLWERYRKAPEGRDRGDVMMGEVVSALSSLAHTEPVVLTGMTELCGRDLAERLTSTRKPISRTDVVRISAAGSYYLNALLYSESYLMFVSQDTIIYRADWFSKLTESHRALEKSRPKQERHVAEIFIRYLVAEENTERSRAGGISRTRPQWDRDFAREMAREIIGGAEWEDVMETPPDLPVPSTEDRALLRTSRRGSGQLEIPQVNNMESAASLESALLTIRLVLETDVISDDPLLAQILWALLLSNQAGIGPQTPKGISVLLLDCCSLRVTEAKVRRFFSSKMPRYLHLMLSMNDGRFGLTPDGMKLAWDQFGIASSTTPISSS
jgi:hypothetical protein